jgi:tRNA (cytidine/uridine-2'-O-)-methyltransferase
VFDVVLVAPEIATNTGNIIRLCANAGTHLHLVEPLGFTMDDASLRRAGLDYHDLAAVTTHADPAACAAHLTGGRRFAFSSHARRRFDEIAFAPGDAFVFGAERAGFTDEQADAFTPVERLAIPMHPENRSINLANAVAIVVYEAWRQCGFAGSGRTDTLVTATRTAP